MLRVKLCAAFHGDHQGRAVHCSSRHELIEADGGGKHIPDQNYRKEKVSLRVPFSPLGFGTVTLGSLMASSIVCGFSLSTFLTFRVKVVFVIHGPLPCYYLRQSLVAISTNFSTYYCEPCKLSSKPG